MRLRLGLPVLVAVLFLFGCSSAPWRSPKATEAKPSTSATTTSSAPVPTEPAKPPIGDGAVLVVGLPKDDCVNLREQPSKTARVKLCLAGGGGLTAKSHTGGLPDGVQRVSSVLAAGDGQTWVHALTASGVEGWAAVEAGQIRPVTNPSN